MTRSPSPARRQARFGWLAAIVLVAGALYFWKSQPAPSVAPAPAAARPASASTYPTRPSSLTAPGPILSPNGDEASHVADQLNSPTSDIHRDLRTVNELFDQFRSAVHGPNPVGENAEIVAALTGKNKLGFSFLPANHPAINSAGQLADRWGTPFFFHQLSFDQMQIRSAGPDRKMYTDDDEVLTPGLSPPHL